jgi:hypothetical protein
LLHEDPQELPLGYTHAPEASQSEAPQAPLWMHDAAQQCVPLPEGPHTPSEHWSCAVHVPPGPFLATQEPPEQYALGDWQSSSVPHAARQDVASAHTTSPGQAAGVPAEQFPDPSQAAGVN